MAYNSSTLQKLLIEYNRSSTFIYGFLKLFTATNKHCVEPDLEHIKSIDNSIFTQLYENIRYVQYIIYSLYDSEYLQKFKLDISNPMSGVCYLLPTYDKLIEDIINNNAKPIVMDKNTYIKYIDKLKEANTNICILIDKIKNNFNNTHIHVGNLDLFNIYESELYTPLTQSEIDNFISAFRYNNKKFLFFSVNKKTEKLEYIIYTSKTKHFIINNNKKYFNTYSKNKVTLSTIEAKPIIINGQYNTKFELLKFPENFNKYNSFKDIRLNSYITTLNMTEFQNYNREYLDLTKYNVYVFEFNDFRYKLSLNNNITNGFYNYKNIGIFNDFRFNKEYPFITSNSVTLLKCRSYILNLQFYSNKIIKEPQLYILFYKETTKLLDHFKLFTTNSHTFKYDGLLYLIMNVINNTFIKLSKPYLNDNDVIKITEYLKLFNNKFVNILH